jgi:hypothetical protein
VEAAQERVVDDAGFALEVARANVCALGVAQGVVGRVEEAADGAQPHGEFARGREWLARRGLLRLIFHSCASPRAGASSARVKTRVEILESDFESL